MDRRNLLRILATGGGFVVGGIIAIPSLLSGLAPIWQTRRRELWESVGPIESFDVGRVQEARVGVPRDDWSESLREKGVYVWRQTEDKFVVFSRNCTDLSCPVAWDPGSECFFCPCHGGIFAKDGERMAGPPKRALYRYASRLRAGRLEIDLASLPPMA